MRTKRGKKISFSGPQLLKKRIKHYGLPKPVHGPEDYPGYTHEEIKEFMSAPEYIRFCEWMDGQTCALEMGHIVVYAEDVTRFLAMIRNGVNAYFD